MPTPAAAEKKPPRAVELAGLDNTPKTKYPAAYKAFHAYFSAHYNPQDPSGAPWSAAKDAASTILKDAASAILTARDIDGLRAWANDNEIFEYSGPDGTVERAARAANYEIVKAYPAWDAVERAARAVSACYVLAECHKRRGEFACYSNGEYRP